MIPVLRELRESLERLLRGPRVSGFLKGFGIDPRRYWLLMDLFGALSDRGEILDQLGRGGVALETVSWMYFGLSALLSLAFGVAQPRLWVFFLTFQILSAFLVLSILLMEAANSLVNPVEALVLAHQPISGATYTSAKLSHLLRIILYLVPGLNAVPALAELTLKDSRWFHPILHMATALLVGLAAALLCCAVFGWLIRFVPVRRLKAAGQLVGAIPFSCMAWLGQIRQALARLHLGRWVPAQHSLRWALAGLCVAGAAAAVVLGLRTLSADYLIRVSGMVHSGSAARSKPRRSPVAALAARWFGGQPARGGCEFVARMMMRDWQFLRQFIPMLIPIAVGISAVLWKGWRTDPFSPAFSLMHLMPHFVGLLLFFVCNILMYGNEYKEAWIFQLASSRAIDGFAGGAFALLWIAGTAIPHLMLAPLLAWSWGVWHGLLFTAYSWAASSVYLALEIRLIDGAPFSRQMDPSRGVASMAVAMAGGVAMLIAVALQYGLLFRWPIVLLVTTVGLGVAAYLLARRSIVDFAEAIRRNLALESGEMGSLYKEVGA